MFKRVFVLGAVLALAILGIIAYSFLKPPKEASGPIEAIPVAVEQPALPEPTQSPNTAEPNLVAEAKATEVATEIATSEPAATGEPDATTEPPATTAPAGVAVASTTEDDATAGPVIFEIVQADSEARFVIDEVLRGAPKTVVGATDQVAAEIAIYVDDPTKSKIGTVLINARSLVTDNEFRNRAIKNRILSTDDHEFIMFTPVKVVGLPDNVTVGTSFAFQIVGDLTVRDVTNQVTFDAMVTPISETQLEGTASVTILYADFGLVIPEAPAVASVADEVRLEIEFGASAK